MEQLAVAVAISRKRMTANCSYHSFKRSLEKNFGAYRDDKRFKKIFLCVPQQPLRLSVRIEGG
jgi:hypothetical protein